MKPQLLNLDSEVLDEFRANFNVAISALIMNMVEKDLKAGEVGGKIKIEIQKKTDKETGEIFLMPKITPDVHMKVGAKGKIECATMEGFIMRTTPGGRAVVASNQITFEDLMDAAGAEMKGA